MIFSAGAGHITIVIRVDDASMAFCKRDLDEGGFWRANQRALECAFAQARELHAGILVSLASFRLHVLTCVCRTLAREGLPCHSEHLRRGLATSHTSDLYLAQACLERCEKAWARLDQLAVASLSPIVAHWRLAGDEPSSVVRDLLADLAAGQELPGGLDLAAYEGSGPLNAWLAVVLRRRLLRQRTHARVWIGSSDGIHDPCASAPTPSEQILNRDLGAVLTAVVRSAWQALSARERLVFVAKYRDGMSQREIARLCAIGEPRVSRIAQNAIDKIQRLVRRRLPDTWPSQHTGLASVLRDAAAAALSSSGVDRVAS